jgi:hypothetical protein
VLADDVLFLGEDLLPWLVLAFGAAMVVGNLAAFFRPPPSEPGELDVRREPPPAGRTLAFVVVGAIAALWALATLVR